MLEMFRMCRKLVMRLILHIFYIFPIDNDKILAVNTLAFNYSDNPKYIFEKLKKKAYPGRASIILPITVSYISSTS